MRKSGLTLNSHGMSILAVLAATAMLGVVTFAIVTLTSTMSSQTTRARQISRVDVMTDQVKAALNHPALCDGALKNALGTNIVWTNVNTRVEIFSIVVGGQTILAKGQCLEAANGTVCLEQMFLRRPIPAQGEGAALGPTAWDSPTGVDYNAYAAVVEFRFNMAGISSPYVPLSSETQGGNARPRILPLYVAVKVTPPRTVDFCYQNYQDRIYNKACSGPADVGPNPDCPAPGGGADAGKCVKFYFISGFDIFSKPSCRCRVVCHTL